MFWFWNIIGLLWKRKHEKRSTHDIDGPISLQKQGSKVVFNKKNGDVMIKKETKERNRRSAKVTNSDDDELDKPSK